MAIYVQPRQKTANATVRQRYARIGGTVVQIDGVPILRHGVATWKHNVLNISAAFVVRFGRKHPGVASDQAFFGLFEVKQGKTESVDRA